MEFKQYKERKVEVTKIDKFEVRYHGDNTYNVCNTKKQAEQIKKRLQEEEKKKTEAYNDEKIFRTLVNERVRFNIDLMIDKLRYSKKDSSFSKSEIYHRLKEIISEAETFAYDHRYEMR